MNGKKYLLDTNTIIYAINDGVSLPVGEYFISIITEMELLSYSKLTTEDEVIINQLLLNFQIVNISNLIKEKTIEIRKNRKVKLPDAIIYATAMNVGALLITNDNRLHKIDEVSTATLTDFLKYKKD